MSTEKFYHKATFDLISWLLVVGAYFGMFRVKFCVNIYINVKNKTKVTKICQAFLTYVQIFRFVLLFNKKLLPVPKICKFFMQILVDKSSGSYLLVNQIFCPSVSYFMKTSVEYLDSKFLSSRCLWCFVYYFFYQSKTLKRPFSNCIEKHNTKKINLFLYKIIFFFSHFVLKISFICFIYLFFSQMSHIFNTPPPPL